MFITLLLRLLKWQETRRLVFVLVCVVKGYDIIILVRRCDVMRSWLTRIPYHITENTASCLESSFISTSLIPISFFVDLSDLTDSKKKWRKNWQVECSRQCVLHNDGDNRGSAGFFWRRIYSIHDMMTLLVYSFFVVWLMEMENIYNLESLLGVCRRLTSQNWNGYVKYTC